MTEGRVEVARWQDMEGAAPAALMLLHEEARTRRQAMRETERAVERLLEHLQANRARELGLEARLDRLDTRNRLLNELLGEQAERCAKATRRARKLESKLSSVTEMLAKAVAQGKSHAAEAQRCKEQEKAARDEVNRRAVQQAELRERLQRLERGATQERAATGESVALQERVMALQKQVLQAQRERDNERDAAEAARGEARERQTALEREVATLRGKVEAARAAASSEQSAATAAASAQAQVHALQDKVDKQVLEIIHLKTELTRREKDILQHKRQLEEQTMRMGEIEEEMEAAKRDLAQARRRVSSAGGEDGQPPPPPNEHERLLQEALDAALGELEGAREALHKAEQQSREKETALQKEIVALNEVLLAKEEEQLQLSKAEADLAGSKATAAQVVREKELERQAAAKREQQLLKDVERCALQIAELQNQLAAAKAAGAESGAENGAKAGAEAGAENGKELTATEDMQPLLNDMVGLLETCKNMAGEVRELKIKLASSERLRARAHAPGSPDRSSTKSDKSPPSSPNREASMIVTELKQLKAACLAQREQATRLREQLLGLKDIQTASLRRVADVNLLERKLHEMKQSEEELHQEAHLVREEARRLSGASNSMVRQLTALAKRKRARATQQRPPVVEQPAESVSSSEDSPPAALALEAMRRRTDSASIVIGAIEMNKRLTKDSARAGSGPEEDYFSSAASSTGNSSEPHQSSTTTSSDAQHMATASSSLSSSAPLPLPPPPPAAPPVANSDGIIKEGYLIKSPPNTGRPYWSRWRKRWFILTKHNLLCSKGPSSKMLKEMLPLKSLSVHAPRDAVDQRANKFYLRTPQRLYQVCAESPEDLADWLAKLGALCTGDKRLGGGRGAALSSSSSSSTSSAAGSRQASARSKEAPRPDGLGTRTFYDILKVDRDAPQAEIAKAHEVLAETFLPGENANANPREFELLTKAYSMLSTPSLRADYDTSLDVRAMFVAGFTALLHPDNRQFYNQAPVGTSAWLSPRTARKVRPKRFYSDPEFTRLYFCEVTDSPAILYSDARPHVPWASVLRVQNGEEAVEGALFELPIDRSLCAISLVTETGMALNIEVDRKLERDKIAHALRLVTHELRDQLAASDAQGDGPSARHATAAPLDSPPPPPPPGSPPPSTVGSDVGSEC